MTPADAPSEPPGRRGRGAGAEGGGAAPAREYPLAWIRERFPALARRDASVFLDNAAGAQVPATVLLKTVEAMTEMQVNKGAAYPESVRVTAAKEAVRARTAAFANAEPHQVAFGPNATTLITLLAEAVGRRLEPGDEIVVSGLDHHANRDPWRRLAERGVVVRDWRPRRHPGAVRDARLHPDDLKALLGPRTRLLAVTAASNATGAYTPLAEAAELARGAGAWLMVDAVHYAPHRLPDVRALGADLLAFSPYKVVGPHLGVLVLGDAVRARLGGHPLSFFPDDDPLRWEPGTQSHEAILGWGGALDYLDAVAGRLGAGATGDDRRAWAAAYRAFEAHERALLERLLAGLDALGYERYGPPGVDGRTATVAFNHPQLPAPALATALAERGVAVAAGHYYAFDLMMDSLDLAARGGAVRASALHYTSAEEIDALLGALRELR